jgi:hypothetical protein
VERVAKGDGKDASGIGAVSDGSGEEGIGVHVLPSVVMRSWNFSWPDSSAMGSPRTTP